MTSTKQITFTPQELWETRSTIERQIKRLEEYLSHGETPHTRARLKTLQAMLTKMNKHNRWTIGQCIKADRDTTPTKGS